MLRAPDGSTTLMRLPPKRDALAGLSDWVDHRVSLLALSDRASYAVRLCVEEAVLNVINHGRPHSDIVVWLGRCAGRLSLCVKDRGAPFDPLLLSPPPRPRDLEAASAGGMGVALMRSFAKEILYRRASSTNRLFFHFNE